MPWHAVAAAVISALESALIFNQQTEQVLKVTRAVTRREFLNLLGAYGGTSAVLRAGTALGLIPGVTRATELSLLPAGSGGKRVAILGSGISGLTVAWELTKAGYDCTVLEASHRPGGRVFTVRAGTVIDEIGNLQRCDWDADPHMYFNAGAARIPGTHQNILGYCKELGVELEIFVNENKMAWVQDDAMLDGRPIRNTDFTTNMRGFISEMLSKSLSESEQNLPFSETEIDALLGILSSYGDLQADRRFTGSFRTGYASGGYLDHGTLKDMVALRDLLQSRIGRTVMVDNDIGTGAGPVLMQPVGGMDRIIYAFANRLGERIRFRAPVTSVTVGDTGVDISYDQNGARQHLQADYCFNCIPGHLMSGIPNNFPADYMTALKYMRRGEAYKAAFQAKERFWEKEDIYGGITWVNAPIQQIWYPPHGIHKDKGVILAAYNYGGGMFYTRMSQAQRVEELLVHGEKVHPNYRRLVEKPVTIAWHRMNNMLGCSARFSRSFGGWSQAEEDMYHLLQKPVNGRHYMIGDQISQHPAWQETAILSAHFALADLDARMREQAV